MGHKINEIIIGKVDKDTFCWLPLWAHLKDTTGVMDLLIQNWVSDSTIASCNLNHEEFCKTALLVAAIHDIGKATSYFQNMITKDAGVLRDELTSSGLMLRDTMHKGETPHAYAGYWILRSDTVGIGLNKSVANVIGAHHGKPISTSSIYGEIDLLKLYPSNFYGEEDNKIQEVMWQSIWKDIVNNGLELAELKSIDDLPDLTVNAQVLLSGLLIVADWIASNTKFFPLVNFADKLKETEYPDRILNGWGRLSFPDSWEPIVYQMNTDIFQERFGQDFIPNEIQKTVYTTVNNIKEPGIIILEAQMGIGKTEAALSAAEVLAAKCHSKGIFFGLPTQATSNALYHRLHTWAESISEDTRLAIELAHGGAVYNTDYQEQMIQGKAFVDDIDNPEDKSGAFVHPWFQGSKRALLSDFVIGTIDQFLMASLKRRHFMLRHLGLSGKIVVIDECHAYDAYMNRYLDQTLEWMAGYGVPVILLSATLPMKRREELINSYLKGKRQADGSGKKTNIKKDNDEWKHSIGYPLLTWTDGDAVHQTKIQQNVVNREICISYLSDQNCIIDTLKDKLQDGGCACIIANTVGNAQKYYKMVKENIPEAKVMLYHARFTMEDRGEKEKLILKKLGKKSTNADRNKFILIGTQVLEQSLDYDVDLMMTEPCPMDLFLQRIGRLHRHERNDQKESYSRPERLKMPECYIIQDIENAYDSGSAKVYSEYLLMRTLSIMPKKMNIPEDIPHYVQRVYCVEDACELDENDMIYKRAKDEFDLKTNKKENNGEAFLLRKPSNRKGIKGILDNEYTGCDNKDNQGVRDIDLSIEVILMKQLDEYHATYVSHGEQKSDIVSMDSIPNAESALNIARQRLHLPQVFSNTWMVKNVINDLEKRQMELKEWQQAPLLKGELILLLDKDQSTELCGYRLHYDFEVGLECEKKEGEEHG